MGLTQFRTISLRVNDPLSLQPTPHRFQITDEAGQSFAPFGAVAIFPTGRNEAVASAVRLHKQNWFYSSGNCEIPLPVGVPLKGIFCKGPEYPVLETGFTLSPGQLSLRLQFEEPVVTPNHWRSGDTRVHFLTTEEAQLQGAAENCTYIELLSRVVEVPSLDGNVYTTISNLAAFSGTEISRQNQFCAVAVNTWNTHPVLGSLCMLNTHRPVYPLAFGGLYGQDDWTIPDWCAQARRKKGLTVWSDFDRSFQFETPCETLVAALLDRIDAIEIASTTKQKSFLPNYYSLLNVGIRIPLIGCSGKESNTRAVGAVRTYASDPTNHHADWIESIRQGKSIVSTGPFLEIRIADATIGSIFQITEASKPTRIHLFAQCLPKDGILQLIFQGRVLHQQRIDQEFKEFQTEIDIVLPTQGWLAARVISSARSKVYPDELLFAHTSPIYVVGELLALPDCTQDRLHLQQHLHNLGQWIENVGSFSSDKAKQDHLQYLDQAMKSLDPPL